MQEQIDWKKYLIAFFISAIVFLGAIVLSNYFSNKKLDTLSTIQENISIDLLSSETQYSLLGTLDCSQISPSAVLSDQLNDLSKKIEYSDASIGSSAQLTRLKESYSLLEIKDYLLMKELTSRCGQKSVFVLYFYTTNDSCTDCLKQGYVLTALREKYPLLRVYSFDYGLNLSAVETLEKIYGLKDTVLPAMVSDGKVYTGFHSVEDIEKLIPKLKSTLVDTTSTSTKIK
ncbi:MAG: hypothetical protein WCO65_03380 [bacterium]